MTLPLSTPLWQTLPLLEFVQFPWRFLGPAAIGLALLCGYTVHELTNYQRPLSTLYSLLSTLTLFLFALPLLFPTPPPPLTHSANRTDLINFELTTGWLGTTSAADYLPSTVQQLPPPTYDTPQLTAAGPTATFNQFAYPGWQATADGRPIPITPTDPHGLIQVTAPPNTQTIQITFANTPLRTATNWISLVTLLALIIGVTSYKVQVTSNYPTTADNTQHATHNTQHSALTTHQTSLPSTLYSLLLILLTLFTLKTTYLDHTNTLFKTASPPPNTLNINFDNQLRLLNATLPTAPIPADGTLTAELAWQLAGTPQQELSVGLHLLSESGARYAQNDNMHPADFPVTRWQPDQYAIDTHPIQLDPTTPPGRYTLELFVYTVQDGRRLNTLSEANTPLANTIPLGQITITSPTNTVLTRDLTADGLYNTPLTLAADLELLGYQLPLNSAELGQTIPLTLFWRTLQPLTDPPQLILLSDTQRNTPHQFPLSPTAPNNQWGERQIGRDQQTLTLPVLNPQGDPLQTGNYFLALLHNDQYQPLTSLRLTAPERTFTPPTPQIPLNTPLGTLTTLIGADTPIHNSQFTIHNSQITIRSNPLLPTNLNNYN